MIKYRQFILGAIFGGIFCGGIGVYAASKFLASDIAFIPANKEWNVTNVEEAMNSLYSSTTSSDLRLLYTNTTVNELLSVEELFTYANDYIIDLESVKNISYINLLVANKSGTTNYVLNPTFQYSIDGIDYIDFPLTGTIPSTNHYGSVSLIQCNINARYIKLNVRALRSISVFGSDV